jgi:probable biosynthetic protein (TIGR04099 family)
MNIPLGYLEIDRILGGGPARPALSDEIVLGMPHLCLGGISETWLLRECGHRHWFLLAQAAGHAVPDFRDEEGDPVYAAFIAVTVREARLDAAHEHDALEFSSRLTRISRTRFMSVHEVAVRGRPLGEVVMTSLFVKRMEAGRNRSIARVEVPALPPIVSSREFADYEETVAALRRDSWKEHLGFVRDGAPVLDRHVIDPCPAQDFNGADFLYFSSFQAFVDRAEWAFFRSLDPRTTTRRRDIVYHGNIEPGDRVVVLLRAIRRGEGTIGHWCAVERESDAAPLANIFTLRDVRPVARLPSMSAYR